MIGELKADRIINIMLIENGCWPVSLIQGRLLGVVDDGELLVNG